MQAGKKYIWMLCIILSICLVGCSGTGASSKSEKNLTTEAVETTEATTPEDTSTEDITPEDDTTEMQTPEDAGQTVDLFLFMGQSNMSGKGDASLAPSVEHGWEFRAISDPTKLYPITEPFGLDENNPEGVDDLTDTGEYRKLGGMVSAFANAYYEETGVPIVGVSCSEGATTVDLWQPGTAFFTDALARLTAAKEYLEAASEYDLRNVYMVWCQGENDGNDGMSADKYYIMLQNIVTSMVKQGGITQCFVVRIGNRGDDDTVFDRVIQAQTELCQESEYCTLVSTQFAACETYDLYHYTQESYNIVGTEAGKNAGIYTNTGEEPEIWDYKTNQMYEP